ncbi:MAG: thymidine phosphorylase [Ignavibacteria bacterium]|nr:thymidine phosphorylase [Ignavibacteria bacterium]
MNTVEIIKKKRNGSSLSIDELKFLIEGYLDGSVADYQMSAFLMAVFFKGMNEAETLLLTELMLNSGTTIDLSFLKGSKADKHSTGGVGDKTSIILAPQLALLGVYVPMISGRGLGHTGGTLDKLQSIPGFNINLSEEEYKSVLRQTGCVMIGQTDNLAPADRKMYALRDVTATVDSIPLITSSILSKKLAEGTDSIVFDVKIGSGANLQDERQSAELAKRLVNISKKYGKKAIAVLTDMSEPLGYNTGNWLEIEECLEVMNGMQVSDLIKVNNVLAGAMLFLAGKSVTLEDGERTAADILNSGEVFGKFIGMAELQKGNKEYLRDYKNRKRAKFSKTIKADKNGFINKLDAYGFGIANVMLGGGRQKTEDKIDFLSGIIQHRKCGDRVNQGDIICELYSEYEHKLEVSSDYILNAIEIDNELKFQKRLIIDIID